MGKSGLEKAEHAFLAAVALLMLVLMLWHYELPGLYSDETDKAVPLLQMMKGAKNVNGGSVDIFGHNVMIVLSDYIGPGLTYLLFPAFLLFGPGVFAIRLTSVLFAVGTVVCVYLVARRFVSSDAASAAALLVAVAPTFVMLQIQGYYNYGPVTFFCISTLYALLRYRDNREAKWLCASAVLAGVGINVALQALWFFAGLGLLAIADLAARRKVERHYAVALLLFLVAASPLLTYTIMTGSILRMIGIGTGFTSSGGTNNLNYPQNISYRWGTLQAVLNGDLAGLAFGVRHHDQAFTPLFAAALLACIAAAFVAKDRGLRELSVIAITVFALTFALSGFTVTGLAPYHLIIMYPPIALVLACGFEFARNYSSRVMLAFFIVGLLSALAITLEYKADAIVGGGTSLSSDAIYQLSDYLLSHREYAPVAMDWGFTNSLYILTKGEIYAPSAFSWSGDFNDAFNESMRSLLANRDTVYISTAPEFKSSFAGGLVTLQKIALGMNRTLVVDKVFYQRDGKSNVVVYRDSGE